MKFLINLIILGSLIGNVVYAQNDNRQFLFLNDWSYELVDYWINNGTLDYYGVLNQPYTISSIHKGLPSREEPWYDLFRSYSKNFYGQSGVGKIILYARDNYSFVSNNDLPVRNVIKAAPLNTPVLFKNRTKNHYNFAGQFNITFPHLNLVNRTSINSEYKDDPAFPGDTNEWIYGRSTEAYANIYVNGFDLFLGRIDRNWGTLSSPGLILSNNPYSYDHAQFSYTSDSEKFKFSMIISRLEDMLAVDSEGAYPDSLMNSRKYLSAHRLDFSFSPALQLALTEIAIYGGPGRDFEFGFLNPMNYYYVVQRNNLQQINGVWALDVFYKPHKKVNLFLQFLLDDIIINNEPGQNDRALRPDRLGINIRLSEADLVFPGLQTGIEYARVGNRTYQSFRTYENFHYQGKGLGYPAASIEKIRIFANYFSLFPFLFKFSGSLQRDGQVKLTDVFTGFKDDKFPVGIVEKSLHLNFDLKYFVTHAFWLSSSLTLEKFTNYGNIDKNDFNNLKFIIGAHMNFSTGLKLN